MRRSSMQIIGGVALLAGGLAIAGPKVVGDPAKAEPIVKEVCAGCHGEDGNSPMPNLPKLAGQHPEYLMHELKEFKAEHRQSEMMLPQMIATLSDEDMANLAIYFAAQKPTPATVTRPELVAKGKKLFFNGNTSSGVPSCDGCHEEDGAGSEKYPRIAGQNPEYTLEEFKRYADKKRPYGKKVMQTVAERLSPEEAEALAQYLASLP